MRGSLQRAVNLVLDVANPIEHRLDVTPHSGITFFNQFRGSSDHTVLYAMFQVIKLWHHEQDYIPWNCTAPLTSLLQ